jgi:hypothetical protein
VLKGDSEWIASAPNDRTIGEERYQLRKILYNNPPNIVVVDQDYKNYGFHMRSPSLWPFIFISEVYVNLWAVAHNRHDDKLALSVLLDAIIKHELGHWFFTLVCDIR